MVSWPSWVMGISSLGVERHREGEYQRTIHNDRQHRYEKQQDYRRTYTSTKDTELTVWASEGAPMDSPGLSNEYCTQKDKIAFCKCLYPVYLRNNIYYNLQNKIVCVAATTSAFADFGHLFQIFSLYTLETSKCNILLYSTPVSSLK